MKTSRSYAYAFKSLRTLYGHKHDELALKSQQELNDKVRAIMKSGSHESMSGTPVG